ncbi:MAG: hypothetical protein WBE85_01895, partial [Methylocella sp.]
THGLQCLVIKSARIIFSHASMESFGAPQVKKNVLLFMNFSIQPQNPPRKTLIVGSEDTVQASLDAGQAQGGGEPKFALRS